MTTTTAPRPSGFGRRTALGAGAGLLAAPALAQAPWPNRPIRLVVPFAQGGSTDVIARLLGEHLFPRLGQPLVPENRPGAAATLATGMVADAQPDGYTVLLTVISSFSVGSVLYRDQIRWDPVRSFQHIGMINRTFYALMINRNFAPGFRIRLHQKDLNLALSSAREMGMALPNTAIAQQMFSVVAAAGGEEQDHSALVQAIEIMAGMKD